MTLTAYDGSNTASCTASVTVSDFANDANTVCVSTSGNFTGCPSNVTARVTTSNFTTALGNITSSRKRVLLRCGETWASGSGYTITQAGPGLIGAYNDSGPTNRTNTCTVPRVTVSSNPINFGSGSASDWRIMDLEFDGGGGTGARAIDSGVPNSNITILRLNAHFTNGIYVDSITTNQSIDNWTIQDTSITDFNGIGIWADHQPNKLAILGSKIWDSHGEHCVRLQGIQKHVANHNSGRNAGSSSSNLKEIFRMTESDQPPNRVVQYVVSSDNRTDSTRTGAANGSYTGQSVEGQSLDVILERNFYVAGTIGNGIFFNGRQNLASNLPANRVTVRNNVFQGTYSNQTSYIGIGGNANAFVAGALSIYNNTFYSGNVAGDVTGILLPVSWSGSHVKNNLCYAPSTTELCFFGGTSNDLLNTSNGSNPNFTNGSGSFSLVTDFKPACATSSTYPCGQGTATPLPGVWKDLLQVNQPSPTDLGAIVH